MKRFLPLVLAAACAHAPDPDRRTDGPSVAEADASFSAATGRSGIRGFSEFIDPEFHSIEPDGSLSDRAAYLNDWSKLLSIPGAAIRWRPVTSGSDGDLGWTAGVYESTGPGGDRRTGRYVSIWKRHPDGRWRVIFDIGVPNGASF